MEQEKAVDRVEGLQHGVHVKHRHGGSERGDLLTNGCDHRFGCKRGAHVEHGERSVSLSERLIEVLANRTYKAESATVLHDAHDAKRVDVVAGDLEFMTNGALVGPEFAGHGFVHNRDPRRVLNVCCREIAAFKKRDAHGAEIAGRDDVICGDRLCLAVRDLITRDFNPVGIVVIAHGYRESDTGDFDAGHGLDPLEKLGIKLQALLPAVTDFVWIEREVKDIARIETEIGALRVIQATDHESRDDEKHERATDLRGDEDRAKMVTAAGHGAAAVADGFDEAAA